MISLEDMSSLSDELADQASCYGLPYGILGIVCWSLFFICIIFTHLNVPLFSPWRWCDGDYQAQTWGMAIFTAFLTIGPAVYTCFRCGGTWIMLLMTLAQLTPWSFKIMNDGFKCYQTSLIKFYKWFGCCMTVFLSLAGWTSLICLTIGLYITEEIFIYWIYAIYVVALLAIIIMITALCKSLDQLCLNIMMAYIASTTHLIGFHVILAQISGNWSGIAPAGAGLISSIIFLVGKRLSFIQ
ncbi:12781_t:CDS:2 [Ambispora leptoticha]|uniref:12781_t:CDS:1 n=1 Tax=Ambispora leptoticha TaxID=144679 RepID=A0A9N9FVV2_9GLOM|nr:12781_t:CDS:2 [Ambispora leptoticha]